MHGAALPPGDRLLRLFVGWIPPPAARRALDLEAARVRAAAPSARSPHRDDLHLTLAFLGPTPAERLPPLIDALARVAAATEPISLRFEGLGAFPEAALRGREALRPRDPSPPRVVYAAVGPPEATAAVAALAVRVADAVAGVGCPPERPERFHAHLTLARLHGPSPRRSRGRRRAWQSGEAEASVHGPQRRALEDLLTRGSLQSTYIPVLMSDVRLLVSEAPQHAPRRGRSAGLDVPGTAAAGPRYRTLARLPFRADVGEAGRSVAEGNAFAAPTGEGPKPSDPPRREDGGPSAGGVQGRRATRALVSRPSLFLPVIPVATEGSARAEFPCAPGARCSTPS